MPKGGYRPNAGRPKGLRSLGDAGCAPAAQLPLDYMLAVMRDPAADVSRRDRMAIAAAPYVHKRTDMVGKKEAAQEAAQAVGGSWAKLLPVESPKPSMGGRKAN